MSVEPPTGPPTASLTGADSAGTLLVTVTGRDRPGVTSKLFSALGSHPVDVLDVEQVVVRGRLVLGVLVTATADEGEVRAAVQDIADELALEVEVVRGGRDLRRAPGGAHVTVLGHPLRPVAVAAIARRIAAAGANIDRIVRLAVLPGHIPRAGGLRRGPGPAPG